MPPRRANCWLGAEFMLQILIQDVTERPLCPDCCRICNFQCWAHAQPAYGAYLMLGGYLYFWASQSLGVPKSLAVLMAIAFGIVLGILKFRLIVKP